MFSATTKEYANATRDSAVDDIANKTGREARNAANKAEATLVDAAETAGRRVRGFIDETSSMLHDKTDKLTHEVQENPVQSTLIALGAGFVLGMLFRR